MISSDTIDNSNTISLPKWANFPLKQLRGEVTYCPTVLIDHHLIIIVHQEISHDDDDNGSDDYSNQSVQRDIFLLAVDLRDNSVQEAKVPGKLWEHETGYTLTKYADNQIIKFGGEGSSWCFGEVVQITIESFEHILDF